MLDGFFLPGFFESPDFLNQTKVPHLTTFSNIINRNMI